MSLDTIVKEFIKDTPPGELGVVSDDIKTIIEDPSKNLSQAYEELIASNPQLIKLDQSSYTIISKYNKVEGSKYQDYVLKKKFNVDLEKGIAIDVEDVSAGAGDDESFLKISANLSSYVEDHFPSGYHYTLIPNAHNADQLTIIIIDEKLNSKNFYNGKWLSTYTYDQSSGELTGEIKINVHYYEEGNVRLNTAKNVSESNVAIDKLVNKISQFEDEFEKQLIINVAKLNDEYFKNLRRQLPINRSKVQWGKSIRNYKLGQDVAGGKN